MDSNQIFFVINLHAIRHSDKAKASAALKAIASSFGTAVSLPRRKRRRGFRKTLWKSSRGPAQSPDLNPAEHLCAPTRPIQPGWASAILPRMMGETSKTKVCQACRTLSLLPKGALTTCSVKRLNRMLCHCAAVFVNWWGKKMNSF